MGRTDRLLLRLEAGGAATRRAPPRRLPNPHGGETASTSTDCGRTSRATMPGISTGTSLPGSMNRRYAEFSEDREPTTRLVLDRSASMVVGGTGRESKVMGRTRPHPGQGPRPKRQPGRRHPLRRSLASEASSGDDRRRRHHPHRPAQQLTRHTLRIGRELDRAVDSRAAATHGPRRDARYGRAAGAALPLVGDLGLHRRIGSGNVRSSGSRDRNDVVALRVVDRADEAPPRSV